MAPQNHQIDRFRGWAVTCLYGALGFFSLLLFISGMYVFKHLTVDLPSKLTFLLCALFAAGMCLHSCYRFVLVMRAGAGIPKLHLLPFLLVAITLVIAARVFAPV